MSATADERRDALVERLFEAVLGFNDLYAVYIGDRLGLYAALRDRGPSTSAELAEATGTHERYVREWLEHQAVGSVLDLDESDGERRYTLPAGHDEVILDPDSPAQMAAFARMMVGMVQPLPAVLDAFRTGGGVAYALYPPDFCEGQGDMNRIGYVNQLASEWLPALADVDERLRADPPARVADVACGVGWSSIAIARGYPNVRVDGVDSDPASIDLANELAATEGVGDRVRFRVADAADPGLDGPYDLATIFEAVHDMSRPVEVLRTVREVLAPDGTVLVADEKVAESFTAPGDEIERLMYGWSVLHCLPVGMAEQPSAATGTVMRSETMRGYATEAGFSEVEVVPIEHNFWRFYRLRP
jgi:2-polyprenyl-3-methyl-5-hydroxy-6-metoxy-1,4-benzoquinol methylase